MKREILKEKRYLGWHIENGWKTDKRPENKDRSRKLKKIIPAILLGFLVESVQHLKVQIYKHNMGPNFTEKIILELSTCKYPVRRCPWFVWKLEGESNCRRMFTTSGSVLGSLLSARKLVIVPEGILYQSSWRTPRRLSSLSVYLIMVEYICQYQEKQKRVCFLEAMLIKIVAIFRVYIIISSVHIRVEHSISWALQSQHQDLISYAQHGCQHVQTVRACQICNVEIF